ncbi:MAG: HipA N-terminal domain-containing protein [Planctomycetes bacterium]|nr:HipA N-terminal domain-containing protein [Planctomycetota bacterium]
MRRANVYCRGLRAGILSKEETGRYLFFYTPEYLNNPKHPAISLSLPKQGTPFESPVLFPFFYGLLAEGDEKTLQCRLLKIDENDHFIRLLKTCQTETIGGVTINEDVTE